MIEQDKKYSGVFDKSNDLDEKYKRLFEHYQMVVEDYNIQNQNYYEIQQRLKDKDKFIRRNTKMYQQNRFKQHNDIGHDLEVFM